MKRNFYLQHPLMAMCDPRMEYLLEKEKLKGTGAYWFVIEKLAMLPDSCGDMKYLRPLCKLHKISFAYVKKIIFGYGLFDFEEDGSFIPAELNPIGRRVQVRKETDGNEDEKSEKTVREKTSKTFKSASESSILESKNDEKQQKTSKEKEGKNAGNSAKVLDNSVINENVNTTNKENIKDIITTAAEKEKEKNADAAEGFANLDSSMGIALPLRHAMTCFGAPDAMLHCSECHTLSPRMPHFIVLNATSHGCSSVAFPLFRCGIGGNEVWHFLLTVVSAEKCNLMTIICRISVKKNIRRRKAVLRL